VVIERAAILARGGEIGARMITDGLHTPRGRPSPSAPPPAPPTSASHPEGRRRSAHPAPLSTFDVGGGKGLRDVEREIILRSLDRNGGNVARTARQLGIPRSTLRARLRRYGQPSGPATTSDD
jgi:DNA-binding NtrC family response regulator